MGTDIFPHSFTVSKTKEWDSLFHLTSKKQVIITISEVDFGCRYKHTNSISTMY